MCFSTEIDPRHKSYPHPSPLKLYEFRDFLGLLLFDLASSLLHKSYRTATKREIIRLVAPPGPFS